MQDNGRELGVKTVRDRVRQIRVHFHLTQNELAEKIGVSTGFISLVETGRSGLSDANIEKICTVFHINASWLVNGTGIMESENPKDWVLEVMPEEEKQRYFDAIAGRIKELRRTLHLSQRQFAAGMGASREIVAIVEQRRNRASEMLLKKIENRYGVRAEWLRQGKGEMFSLIPEANETSETYETSETDSALEPKDDELVHEENQYIVRMQALLDECSDDEKKDLVAMAELYVKAIKRRDEV